MTGRSWCAGGPRDGMPWHDCTSVFRPSARGRDNGRKTNGDGRLDSDLPLTMAVKRGTPPTMTNGYAYTCRACTAYTSEYAARCPVCGEYAMRPVPLRMARRVPPKRRRVIVDPY